MNTLGCIVLDTVNMSKSAGRGTDSDASALQQVRPAGYNDR